MAVLTRDILRSYVRSELGKPIVEVELENTQIDDAISDAINLINAYVPCYRWGAFPSGDLTSLYKFTDDADLAAAQPTLTLIRGLQAIVDIQGVRDSVFTNAKIDVFDPLVYIAGGAASTGGLASYMQAVELLEEARRLFGSEVEWQGQWIYDESLSSRVYHLYIDTSITNRLRYGYKAIISLTPDDNVATGLAYVHPEFVHWVKKYVLAKCRAILGRGLRKFQGIPSTEGVDMQLDGSELVQEGQTEADMLEEELKGMRNTLPPITG